MLKKGHKGINAFIVEKRVGLDWYWSKEKKENGIVVQIRIHVFNDVKVPKENKLVKTVSVLLLIF
jgi:hypothetical protein